MNHVGTFYSILVLLFSNVKVDVMVEGMWCAKVMDGSLCPHRE